MKRALILAVVVLMMFSFMFMGCTTGTVALTDDEVSKIAMAVLGTGSVSFMLLIEEIGDGEYVGPALGGLILSGTLIVSDTGTIFTFADCELDFSEPLDTEADVTLDGAFSAEQVGETIVITYSAFNLIGMLGPASISATSTGTFTIDIAAGTFSVDITISGITAAACAVVLEMTGAGEQPDTVTSATINGVDYTAEFIAAFAEIGA